VNEERRLRGDRRQPGPGGIVEADPAVGGGAASPSFALPAGADQGLPGRPRPLTIRGTRLDWGTRTFVMGILNITPDSFSGDGLLGGREETDGPAVDRAGAGPPVRRALDLVASMVAQGADLIDVGGESSRPGHATVAVDVERDRVVPIVSAIRAAMPGLPISVDTVKAPVAAAALEAGADIVNDVWGVAEDDAIARIAADHEVPLILMHNRAEARYRNLMAEIVADLDRAMERALAAGVAWDRLIVDPGFGFGKTPAHNIVLLRELEMLRVLGRPILLGTSRKSTLGKLLDLPPEDRLEATLATTALAVAARVDMVRVHDVEPNVRAARVADAIIRGGHPLEVGS
jgi:dihydropteroate synthase